MSSARHTMSLCSLFYLTGVRFFFVVSEPQKTSWQRAPLNPLTHTCCSSSVVLLWKTKRPKECITEWKTCLVLVNRTLFFCSCKHVPLFPFHFLFKTMVTKNSFVICPKDAPHAWFKSKPGHKKYRAWLLGPLDLNLFGRVWQGLIH